MSNVVLLGVIVLSVVMLGVVVLCVVMLSVVVYYVEWIPFQRAVNQCQNYAQTDSINLKTDIFAIQSNKQINKRTQKNIMTIKYPLLAMDIS